MTDTLDEPLDPPPDGAVTGPPDEQAGPDDGHLPDEDEDDEPDEDDTVDWAAADFGADALVSEAQLEQMVEPVADGTQDMPEEPSGWAKPFNRPKRFEPRAV